jgi:ethanolamine utilization protein EutA
MSLASDVLDVGAAVDISTRPGPGSVTSPATSRGRLHRLPPDSDVVELLTVGIDVGSATFHVSVSRVVLERRAQALSTRYDVVARETVAMSPVGFTPYLASDDIDAAAVDAAVRRSLADAGVDPEEIDSGVVLLTGSALLRHNARALADLLAAVSGRFVCAAAGHHFEATLAAHGSGAVARSMETPVPVVALDLGGATTKMALVSGGDVQATAAVAAGSRLLAWDRDLRLVRVEDAVAPLAESMGVDARLGRVIEPAHADAICERMAIAVVGQLDPRLGEHARGAGTLLLTEPFPSPPRPFEIVASGGVAEFFGEAAALSTVPGAGVGNGGDGEDAGDLGDLGPGLARALLLQLEQAGLDKGLQLGVQRIRATVIGASQFSTQVSGSTLAVDPAALPLHHVPVVRPALDLVSPAGPDPVAVARALVRAVRNRFSGHDVPGVLAVSLGWGGEPSYARLRALAAGLVAGQREARVGQLVVVLDADVASSLGRIMATEFGVGPGTALCLDGLDLAELDYVDVGRPVEPAKVVPVVVKSLLFGGAEIPSARRLAPTVPSSTADGSQGEPA